MAALCNATIVNFANVANDAQVPRSTVYEYFEILKDTLVLLKLPAWRRSGGRKPIVSSKYYFFDVGVTGALQGRQVRPGTPEFGPVFETWMMHELSAHRDYGAGEPLRFWRSTSGFEVDFIHHRRSHGRRDQGQDQCHTERPALLARAGRRGPPEAQHLRQSRTPPACPGRRYRGRTLSRAF